MYWVCRIYMIKLITEHVESEIPNWNNMKWCNDLVNMKTEMTDYKVCNIWDWTVGDSKTNMKPCELNMEFDACSLSNRAQYILPGHKG